MGHQIGRTVFLKTVQGVYFAYVRPLHDSALTGHLQVEHTILYEVTTPTTDHVAAEYKRNKHLEQLLRKTVLTITLVKRMQQDAELQNKK
jgi:hypothetical protein